MVRLRLAGSPTARRRRRGGTACAGPPAVGEPPPSFRPALGVPRSPHAATSAHLPVDAVDAIIRQALRLWPQDPIVLLQHCGAQDAAAELLRSAGKYNYQTASPDQCTTSAMPTPISLFAESDKCEVTGAHCAPPNDTALMSMSSPLLPCSANTPANAMTTPRRQLAFPSTTLGPLPPGSPLLQPATTCAPQRTTGLAVSAAIGLDDELSTLDMAGRSTAINPVPNETGSACTALPMTAVSAANHSLLPPGPPLLHPATLCVPQRNAGLAAGTMLGMVDSMDPMGRIMVQDGAGRAHSQAAREWKAGVLSIFLREFQTAYGRDPPWMLLDGDFQQHETVLTLNTNGLLPPGSPLPNPATMCAPLRTDGLAAGTTHFSSRPLLALIAQLSAWIASSSQFAKSGREEPLVEFLYYDDLGIGDDDFG